MLFTSVVCAQGEIHLRFKTVRVFGFDRELSWEGQGSHLVASRY